MSQSLPTIAIIGQSNAGKSSLLNRIARSRQAIVAREAGTTRDSVAAKITYQQHDFWLVDTAGLKTPEDDFEASIQEQITEAVEAADVILVACDSTLYPDHNDRHVAKMALKSGKPVILTLTKADLAGNLNPSEFRSLGIKAVIKTSAEHNIGIHELLEEVIRLIPKKTLADTTALRLALVGRPNAGKSSLFNALAAKQQAIISSRPGTTRDVSRVSVHYKGKTLEIADTAGMRKPGRQEVGIEKFSALRTLQAIEMADICLLVVDATDYKTQLDQRLAGIIDEAGRGLIVVVSKWDLIDEKETAFKTIADDLAKHFSFTPWAPLIFTSSITTQNVTRIFDLALEIDARRHQQIKTSELNRVLQTAIRRHPPAGLKNTHPKLRYIVQTDDNPPWFVVYGSSLKHLHWSYERYLIRSLREAFDFVGTPIKLSFREDGHAKLPPSGADS